MTFPPCKKDLCSNECMLYYTILCYLYLFCIINNYIFMISCKVVCLKKFIDYYWNVLQLPTNGIYKSYASYSILYFHWTRFSMYSVTVDLLNDS